MTIKYYLLITAVDAILAYRYSPLRQYFKAQSCFWNGIWCGWFLSYAIAAPATVSGCWISLCSDDSLQVTVKYFYGKADILITVSQETYCHGFIHWVDGMVHGVIYLTNEQNWFLIKLATICFIFILFCLNVMMKCHLSSCACPAK